MFSAWSDPRRRPLTLGLLTAAALAAVVAFAIGFDGNAVANTLARVASAALVLAVAHPWRRAREFEFLVYASALAFVGFVAPHGLFDWAQAAAAGVPFLAGLFRIVSVGAFFAAVYLCPVAFAIGIAGVVVMLLWRRETAAAASTGSS